MFSLVFLLSIIARKDKKNPDACQEASGLISKTLYAPLLDDGKRKRRNQ